MTLDWDARFRQAEERRAREKAARSGLTRIGGTKSELRLPPDVFARLGGVSTLAEAEWSCETCGETPAPREYANGFIPGACLCQRRETARAQQEKRERERLAQWSWEQERERLRCQQCYTWLGDAWGAFGLDLKTFENFEMNGQDDGFAFATAYAQNPHGTLVLFSEACGTGKTHLAAAICNALVTRGIAARFTTAQGLFDAFSARMDDHQGTSDLLASASKAPLLVIDNLDAVHMTSYKQSVFFEVLNQRYLRQLPTVFTTNARVEMTATDVIGISDYVGKKAASRLCDRANGGIMIVEMNGEDYRRRERRHEM